MLEFFAGIGGMRAACALSGLEAVPMRGAKELISELQKLQNPKLSWKRV